eukprot:2776435-Prymnesium_polylepis.1
MCRLLAVELLAVELPAGEVCLALSLHFSERGFVAVGGAIDERGAMCRGAVCHGGARTPGGGGQDTQCERGASGTRGACIAVHATHARCACSAGGGNRAPSTTEGGARRRAHTCTFSSNGTPTAEARAPQALALLRGTVSSRADTWCRPRSEVRSAGAGVVDGKAAR